MFYNGFTLLMQMFAGAMMYWVGRYYGLIEGRRETYNRIKRANKNVDDQLRNEYFSRISKK
jgi:hypothetical protein